MTEARARMLFDKLCMELYQAGWDVLAVISKKGESGSDTVERTLMHGADEGERAQAFFRCNRALRDELSRANDVILAQDRANLVEKLRASAGRTGPIEPYYPPQNGSVSPPPYRADPLPSGADNYHAADAGTARE